MKRFGLQRESFLFSVRVTLAALIALWIAIGLKLESPHWAAITVFVVTQPSRGKTLSKGFYRFLGTLIGGLYAVFLISCFGQSPWLFIIFLAAWVGFTTAFANLVQYFRAYGTMLAGFTSALVGLTVFSHPDQVYPYAQARVISILLGISVALVMASFLNPTNAKKDLYAAIDRTFRLTLQWAAQVFSREDREKLIEGERQLITEIGLIDELATYAGAESLQVRRQKRSIHSLLAQLFATISSTRAVGLHFRKFPVLVQQTAHLRRAYADFLNDPQIPFEEPRFTALPPLSPAPGEGAAEKVLADRLGLFRSSVTQLFSQYENFNQNGLLQSGKVLAVHRDLKHARGVGLRSILAVLTAGALWLLTRWNLGPLLVIMTAVHCGIFATNNNPRSGLWMAFKASLLSIVLAYATLQLLEIGPQNIFYLFLLMAVVLVPGALLITHPTRSLAGTLFCANYLMFTTPTFPRHVFHLESFLNLGLAFFASIVVIFAFYTFIFPSDPERRGRRMIRDIIRDLERMARAPNNIRASEWETLMYSRVGQVIKVLSETGEVKHGQLEGCFAVLDTGQQILKLHERLSFNQTPVAEKSQIQKVLSSLSHLSRNPGLHAVEIKSIALAPVEYPSSLVFSEIAERMQTHEEFFKQT